LRNAYKDNNNNELGQWLKLFLGLPFLPSDEIEDVFLALMAECPGLEEGHVFCINAKRLFLEIRIIIIIIGKLHTLGNTKFKAIYQNYYYLNCAWLKPKDH